MSKQETEVNENTMISVRTTKHKKDILKAVAKSNNNTVSEIINDLLDGLDSERPIMKQRIKQEITNQKKYQIMEMLIKNDAPKETLLQMLKKIQEEEMSIWRA